MDTFYLVAAFMLLCVVRGNCQDCAERPPLQPYNDCCKINLAPQQEECLHRINEQWAAFQQSPNKDSIKIDWCSANCLANNTNLISSDNKVNSDEVKTFLEKLLGAEWEPLLSNLVDTCKERIDNFNPNGPGPNGPAPHVTGPNGPMANCNMLKEKLFFCLREQFLLTCPASSWKNDEDCNEMRNYVKNCPFDKRGGPRRQP